MIVKIIKKIYHFFPKRLQYIFSSKYNSIKEKKYVKKSLVSKKKFKKIISKYDVISFDIFDTLITRKVYNPDDVFRIMGVKLGINDFLEKRKNAEKKAIEHYKHDVNIDEIYLEYSKVYNLSHKESILIKQLEQQLEIELICPRIEMLNIFNEIKNNKIVILTSDMYLDKDTIIKMLEKCGYFGYNYLFLSNEVKARKDTGKIWDIVKKKYNKKIIHVGDNDYSDVLLPKKYSIDTFKIYSSKEIFKKSPIYKYIEDKFNSLNISESLFYGLIVNKKIYNSPFSTFELNSIENVGYALYAPLINSFMEFINKETKEKEKLLFLSREGYNLKKLYSDYCKINNIKENNSIYFLVSRKATKGALLSCDNEIYSSLDEYFKGDLKSFYKQIFSIDFADENINIELPKDKKIVLESIKKYKKCIIKKGKIEKENYLKYINKTININDLKQSFLIDLGYSGSIQFNLSKLLDMNLKGMYLLSSDNVKKYKSNSILKYKLDSTKNEIYLKVYHYSLLLEYFLTAPFGQLLSFDENGNPIYNDEIIDENKKRIISTIYSECLEFMHDINLMNEYFNVNINDWDISFIFTGLIENNMISRRVKNQFNYYDAHSFSVDYNIFQRIGRY